MKIILKTLITAALLMAALQSQANVEIYFSEDVSPWPINGPNQVPRQAYPNSQAMASQFLARLHATHTESFESYSTGSYPTTLAFGATTATLSESGTNVCAVQTVIDPNGTDGGWFPSTGTNFLGLDLGSTNRPNMFFRITFSSPQAALGFYGTDVEIAQFRLTLERADGSTNDIVPPLTTPQGSGGVHYLGVIDRANPFVSVTFHNSGSDDGFGFDDLTIGTPNLAPAQLQLARYPQLQITGTVGATYRIDFSSVLPATNWVTVTNCVLPASPYSLTNVIDTNSPRGFYRAIGIP